jgi:uncharacterized cupin superfamily protein
MSGRLIKFPLQPAAPKIGAPAGWTVISGDPQARAWRHYANEDASLLAGLWECTPGVFHVVYDKWEFCQMLSGSCVITSDGGASVELGTGDAFVVEPGFKGRWEVTKTMRKHFVFSIAPRG